MTIWQYAIARVYNQLTATAAERGLMRQEKNLAENLAPIMNRYEASDVRVQALKAKAGGQA